MRNGRGLFYGKSAPRWPLQPSEERDGGPHGADTIGFIVARLEMLTINIVISLFRFPVVFLFFLNNYFAFLIRISEGERVSSPNSSVLL